MRHLRRCRRTRGIRVLSGVCPVVVRVTKCYPCGELQSRCAMEYDQDKVDEMVLALLSLTMFEEDLRWGESVERVRLGRNGSAAREGLCLRSQEQGQVGRGDRERRAAIPRAVRETLRQERTGRAPAVGFAATGTEPFRSGKRVRARITARQAPFRKDVNRQ